MPQPKLPKVLVGSVICDVYEYCTPQLLKSLHSLTYKNYNTLLVDNSQKEDFYKRLKERGESVVQAFSDEKDVRLKLVECRNLLRQKVLEEGYDYLLSVDQDVIPPKDIIERLLSHQKKVVTGVYYNRFVYNGKQMLLPILYREYSKEEQEELAANKESLRKNNPKFYSFLEKNGWDFSKAMRQLTPEEVEQPRLMQIKSCGTGCLFIHRSVLEKISFRRNTETKEGFEDVMFCQDLRKHNIPLYADTSIKCMHLISKKPWKWG